MDLIKERIRESVGRCLYESFLEVAGGSFPEDSERTMLREIASSSVSFPNKNHFSVDGKPHDTETRFALSCFHRLKRTMSTTDDHLELVSDLGLVRHIRSPKEMAELLLLPLEMACRREGHIHDIRVQSSGLMYLVTVERSLMLRQAGQIPCPLCIKWCHGEKGLWWHQQQNHNIEHSTAAELAAASTNMLAMIPYTPNQTAPMDCWSNIPKPMDLETKEPLDFVKEGNLSALKHEVESNGYIPSLAMDRKGASPVMWAAGGGHLETVRYLVEACCCDPNQPQQGKRSFSGRTSLHWAARNGHLSVVKYLVLDCHVDTEASTIDGTTAFGWSSWQGHVEVMDFLHEHGCNIHTINSFGCNAVLWAAQGKGDARILEWLQAKGCDMTNVNNNGHGVFHKAAQRGHAQMCTWFYQNYIDSQSDISRVLRLIGPDTEGYCGSDLAGMEGHDDLARVLARMEMDVACSIPTDDATKLPAWLTAIYEGLSMRVSGKDLYSWEKYGGVRRIRSKLR